MNTTAKILVGAVVIAGAAAFYLSRQGTPVGTSVNSDPNFNLSPSTLPTSDIPSSTVLGPGQRPWAAMFNDQGELTSRFRAQRFDPRENSTFEVAAPEFEYFRSDGGLTRLVGKTGRVYVPAGSTASSNKGGFGMKGQSMPSRGLLKDVTMYVYDAPPEGAPPGTRGPEIVAAGMDNVSFDYDTLRIATEAAVINGRQLPADKIPVTVRGKDFDFDGEGLVVRINQRDQEIQSLDIAHGGRLVVKSSDRINMKGAGKKPAPQPAPAAVAATPAPAPGPSGAAPTPAAPTANAPPVNPVYRLTLNNNIHLIQGPDMEVAGDIMQIDFAKGLSKSMGASSTPPATKRNTPPTATPSSAPASPSANPPGTPSPSAEPADPVPPMIVTWDGPLHLVLGDGDPRTPEKNAIATITGKDGVPVLLRNRQSEARAPIAVFESATRFATLRGDEKAPVVLTDDRGSVVTTPLLTFDSEGLVARLKGNTKLSGNVESENGAAAAAGAPKAAKTFDASWTGEGVLYFVRKEKPEKGTDKTTAKATTTDSRESFVIESANLSGDVRIDHPELQLTSDSLELAFDPTTKQLTPKPAPAKQGVNPDDAKSDSKSSTDMMARGNLRDVRAKGNVKARMLDDGSGKNKSGFLNTDDLHVLFTPDAATGKMVPTQVVATGNVEGSSEDSVLSSDTLLVQLTQSSTTQPSKSSRTVKSDWSSLTATGKVIAKTSNGELIQTPYLLAQNTGNKNRDVELKGPGTKISTPDATIITDRVLYSESTGKATLPLPGQVKGVTAAKPGEKPTPFSASWQGNAVFNRDTNTLDVVKQVQFESTASDGTILNASGDEMHVLLEEKPQVTKPVSDVKAVKPPPNNAAARRSPPSDFGDKQLSSMKLLGNVVLNSKLLASDGALLRRFYLEAAQVNLNKDRDFEVPVPGRLLAQDNSPTGDKPASDPASGQLPGRRGATAISWKKSLVYRPAANDLTFLGDVKFVHQPQDTRTDPKGQSEPPYHLYADKLTAKLVRKDTKDKAQSDPAAASADSLNDKIDFESVIASGNLTFAGRGMTIYAGDLTFDPKSKIINATGNPARIDQATGAGVGEFDSARINLTTGMIDELVNPTGSIGNSRSPLPDGRTPAVTPKPQNTPKLNSRDRELQKLP